MKVEIRTPNGAMLVDLAEFLPASKTRVRKLFRLMECGLDPAAKKSVKDYLCSLKKTDKMDLAKAAEKDREKKISNIDAEIKRLNEEKVKLKEEQMEAKRRIKAEQQIQSNVDDWIREFCYCAGYVEDTDGTEDRRAGTVGGHGTSPPYS